MSSEIAKGNLSSWCLQTTRLFTFDRASEPANIGLATSRPILTALSRRHQCAITSLLESAFDLASTQGLSPYEIRTGSCRPVILPGWGDSNHHAAIKATSWYAQHGFLQHWDNRQHPLIKQRFPDGTTSFIASLDAFGIRHRINGHSIADNAGNRSAFALRLLLGLYFLTEDQRELDTKDVDLDETSGFPGPEKTLARDNRPPGSVPLPSTFVPYRH
ncbi:Uu.00g028500.m01.CDS01 [Anthostomella pinea]|uniref:Uu.00g028500.m01.CDS01 n=1 Tax=Anthostomella pinea TaxID=933095 RepID=A0AAI8YCT5_9PEZI|nr:Uu.00g028500.m01.CDS01 [Anthostomella pinea]